MGKRATVILSTERASEEQEVEVGGKGTSDDRTSRSFRRKYNSGSFSHELSIMFVRI